MAAMILHTVNKSPFSHNALATCLKAASPGATLLLIEDGVYAALNTQANQQQLQDALRDLHCCALLPDLTARGIDAGALLPGVTTVDYSGFVELVTTHDSVSAWF